jgi:hypothetical protein
MAAPAQQSVQRTQGRTARRVHGELEEKRRHGNRRANSKKQGKTHAREETGEGNTACGVRIPLSLTRCVCLRCAASCPVVVRPLPPLVSSARVCSLPCRLMVSLPSCVTIAASVCTLLSIFARTRDRPASCCAVVAVAVVPPLCAALPRLPADWRSSSSWCLRTCLTTTNRAPMPSRC